MLLELCLALLQVQGLEAGERFTVLPPEAVTLPEGTFVHGRVVDAFTGAPVQGAAIECWTEEITARSGGLRRVGEARSDERGQFRLRWRHGGLVAQKVRVRADGYLSFSGAPGDEDLVELYPSPSSSGSTASPAPPRLAVLDVHGRPIPNARVTTTYSCAHDVPAFEVATDAFGHATLLEYGLHEHAGQLRLLAPGHGGVKYLGQGEVFATRDNGLRRVVLGRRPVLRARLLDRDGSALANTALFVQDGDGHHALLTDAEGRVRMEERYDGTEVTIHALRGQENEHLLTGALRTGQETTLLPFDHGLDSPMGSLLVSSGPDGGEGPVTFRLAHERGFLSEGSTLPTEPSGPLQVPAGRWTLSHGGAFTPILAGELEVVVPAEGLARVEVLPRPAPWLHVQVPTGDVDELLVQAGADSVRLTPGEGEDFVVLPVPVEQELVVVGLGSRCRRVILPPLPREGPTGSASAPAIRVDLTPESARAPELDSDPLLDPADLVTVTLRTLPDSHVVLVGHDDIDVQESSPGVFTASAPRGARLLAIATPYEDDRAVTGAHLLATEDLDLTLSPGHLASVTIESELAFEVQPPYLNGLECLNPGPILIELRLEDGRRVALDLELDPGENRTLRLTD